MRRVYTTVESRRYGTLLVSFCYDDGNSSSVTNVRIPESCIIAQSLVLKRGFDALPLGLEKVPQLEVSLANNEIVRNEVLEPLWNEKRVYVIVDYMQSGGVPIRNRARTPDAKAIVLFVGVVNARVEVDIVKDAEIKLVADHAVHWWLDQLTAADLYAELQSSYYSSHRLLDVSGYEAHPETGIVFGTIGSNDIRGLRWLDYFNATEINYYFFAFVRVAVARINDDIGVLGLNFNPTMATASVNYYRMVSGTLTPVVTAYVYTDYQSSDSEKRYWGALWHVRSARSLRDALKEILESLAIAGVVQLRESATFPVFRYLLLSTPQPLRTTSQLHPKTWVVQSHKLFHSIISSINVTCDAWHGDNNRDREVTRTKRWLDYGVRLGVHNIPLLPSKSYVRLDGSYWVARPENYNRLAMRRLAFSDGVRVWTVLPMLDELGRTILDSPTIDGITYSYTLPTDVGPYGLHHSMYETLPAHLFAVFGRSSQARLEYVDTSGALYNLGDKYGLDYVIGQSINLATCVSTIECIRYAA